MCWQEARLEPGEPQRKVAESCGEEGSDNLQRDCDGRAESTGKEGVCVCECMYRTSLLFEKISEG